MSIRARLLLIALVATLVPALLLLVSVARDRDAAIASDRHLLAQLAERNAEDLEHRIRGTAQLHYGLARAGDLATDDRAACSAFLAQVRAAYPQYTGILTIRPDGRLFCDSLQTGRELDLTNRDYFRRALSTRDEVVLEPTFGRLTGLAVMQVAYPVRDAQGALRFVLLASLDLQKVLDLGGLAVPGARALITDAKGVVLAAAPAAVAGMKPGESLAGSALFAFAGAAGDTDAASIAQADGQPFHWTRAPAALTQRARVHVLVGAPEASLVAAADRRFAQELALLAGVAVVLFGSLGLLVELALRRPIARMQDLAQRLSAGDLEARIAPPLPRGELGTLMDALNQAAQSLQGQREDIARLNERLLQSQRLEAIGQLTGGVAHDFNNLLTVVLGNAEMLAELSAGDELREPLARMIAEAGQRGAALTQQLLAFARKQPLAPSAVDVNQLVAGMDTLLRRTLGEHIEIELVRGAGLWPATVDAAQLESALLNLCLNARDAMPGGGKLTLETANASFDAAYVRQHAELAAGQYVMLAVSDSGCGIPAQHLRRVFEPFFTTKAKGKGTGLGLAMVWGFMKQSAGHVTIYSEPGHGTTVKLYLPRALGAAEPRGAAESAPVQRGEAEAVLVVEDDAPVRELACRELRSLGYQVLEAASGPAALTLLREGVPVDLLFTDVVMPGGLSGRELADAARALRPGLRVLYTSGYTENAIVHQGRLDAGVRLLPKPYRRADLARAVREALAAA